MVLMEGQIWHILSSLKQSLRTRRLISLIMYMMERDFTYIDDVVEGIKGALKCKPEKLNNKYTTATPRFRIYNLGNNNPVKLKEFLECIEDSCGKKARINHLPMQPGDVKSTFANIDSSMRDLNFKPKVKIKEGLKNLFLAQGIL